MMKQLHRCLPLITLLLVSCGNMAIDSYQQKLQKAIDEISKMEGYPDGPFEFGDPEKPDTNHPYFYLRDSVEKEDLKRLLNHINPIIRIYSFRALTKKYDSANFQTLIEHLSDTTKIMVFYYDVISPSTVADIMISIGMKNCYFERDKMDLLRDMILLHNNNLETTNHILNDIKPIEKYYETIRRLAQENYSESAYIALAQYKKREDIPIIKMGFDSLSIYRGEIFKAIEYFPNPAFLPMLFNHFDTRVKKDMSALYEFEFYFKALAKYQRSDCLRILNTMKQREYYSSDGYYESNRIHILNAIHKYYCPLYKELYEELKMDVLKYGKYRDPYYKEFFSNDWW